MSAAQGGDRSEARNRATGGAVGKHAAGPSTVRRDQPGRCSSPEQAMDGEVRLS